MRRRSRRSRRSKSRQIGTRAGEDEEMIRSRKR